MDLCKFIRPQTVLCSRGHGPSLYCMHITFFTHVEYTLPLSARVRLRLVRRRGAGSRTCLYHICMVLQQPAHNHCQQRACPLDSKTLRQPQAFLFQPLPLSLFNRLCCAQIQATHHNLCLPHVHSQINPSSPSQISMSSTLPEVPRWTWTQH